MTMAPLGYPAIALDAVDRVWRSQQNELEQAATIMATTIATGGVIQTFGTGHSRAVTLEFCARAGGLAPMGLLAVKDLVMFGGEDPKSVLDPKYERESGLARRIYDLARPRPEDAFIIVSNSGINAAIVEMATLVREREHQIIAITSAAHSLTVPSRDASGLNLRDLADVVLDNGAPVGDAAVGLPDGSTVCGVSNLTGIFLAQVLVEWTCRMLLERGSVVPAFRSSNTPGADVANDRLFAAFEDRIRPIEP